MTDLEIVDETLRTSGWPGAETVMRERWHDAQPDFATAHFINGFGHPDGKFRFKADWAAIGTNHAGMSALPDHVEVIDGATAEKPFRLVAAPARSFLNTTFTEMPSTRRRENRPTLLVHPADAARLGIAEGGRVRLGNARGEVVLHARLVEGAQPGVVVAESIWPHADHDGGIGINALTSDEPALPDGGAVFHDTAVWLRAEAATLAVAAE